jgi:CheY-like chemotaxis protein
VKELMPTILVVDDYSVTIRVLSTQLRKGGYDVVTASNGSEALSQLEQQKIDLAIVDIAMPDMDGITLLEQVRSNQQLAGLPIVMLTASVLDDDRLRALKAGASGFLTKPVSSWELLDIVNRQLQTKT